MYMDGKGIMRKTDDLNDDLWDALTVAIIGSTAMSLGAFFAGLAFWLGHPFFGTGLLVLIPAGWLVHRPYSRALTAVKKHRRSLDAETETRGRNWAQS